MDLNELQTAIDLVNKAYVRAIDILRNPPYNQIIEDHECSYIYLSGSEAIVCVPFIENDYDGPGHISEEHFRFPSSLLALSNEELAAWQLDQLNSYNVEKERLKKQAIELIERQKEVDERNTLRLLKAKYET